MHVPVMAAVAMVLMATGASNAAGQTAEPPRRPSLNIGAGYVSASSDLPRDNPPGGAALFTVGSDIPLSRRWSVRLEAGRRVAGTEEFVSHSRYYLSNPAAPNDPRQAIEVLSTTRVEERSYADGAILVRYATPPGRRFELAGLAGLDFHVLNIRASTTIPRSLTDPNDVDAFSSSTTRWRMVFDVGLEAGVPLSKQWMLLAYGIAGLQSPVDEHRREQLRAGVIFKRRY